MKSTGEVCTGSSVEIPQHRLAESRTSLTLNAEIFLCCVVLCYFCKKLDGATSFESSVQLRRDRDV